MWDHFKLIKCTCGFGDGFYHYEGCGSYETHEFNPDATHEQATESDWEDRKPVAIIAGHIDGRRVFVRMGFNDVNEISFTYAKYGSRKDAFLAAVDYVLNQWSQPRLF